MPTIIIETGEIVPNANSYATVDELTDYASDRGVTLTETPSVLLLRAMDYAESLNYGGRKTAESQPLQWPRTGTRVDGFNVPSDMIPGALVTAQIVTAMAIDAGRDPLAPVEPGVKRERVAELEVEYQDGASSRAMDVGLSRAWARLTGGNGGANQVGVVRV